MGITNYDALWKSPINVSHALCFTRKSSLDKTVHTSVKTISYLGLFMNFSDRRIAICIWVETPHFFGIKFIVPDTNVVNRKMWCCFIAASNHQGNLASKAHSTSPSIFSGRRGITSIDENCHCTSSYWTCNEIPLHERGQGDSCIEPWTFISAGHCDYTLTPPNTEPNGCKSTATVINEHHERGPDLGIHLQPKGHGHSRITLTRTEKAATRMSSKIHISPVAVNIDGVTNQARYDSSSTHQRAIQKPKYLIRLRQIQRKFHHWICRTRRQ